MVKKFKKKDTSKKVIVGPSESMSKSKKNTIDPEKIIENYGADAARLFILSDSPPEKDVQWSEEGIASSHKFIQKLWSLNKKILDEINKDHKEDTDDKLTKFTNKFIKKMTNNLDNFSYNKIIANFMKCTLFSIKKLIIIIKKNYLKKIIKKYLITMMPIIPHFANECLEMNKFKKNELNWPKYDEKLLIEDNINFVIQINGKKRALIQAKNI